MFSISKFSMTTYLYNISADLILNKGFFHGGKIMQFFLINKKIMKGKLDTHQDNTCKCILFKITMSIDGLEIKLSW